MICHDHLRKATANGIRAFAAVTTQLVEEARQRHDCYPIATAALGRTMTGALLLAANLKTEESITIRVDGKGPLGAIIADARADGTVRGYVKNPHTDLPLRAGKLDVGGAVGVGELYITRFTGLKEPFTGSTPLVSGEVAEDITHYLYHSEQTPSTLSLGVLIKPDLSVASAGGLMIQALPGADDQALASIEANLAAMPLLSQFIAEGQDAETILQFVFAGLPATIYSSQNLAFQCSCSRDRVINALLSLGYAELSEVANDGKAELTCHFCNQKYHFTLQDLENLLETLKNESGPPV